MPARPAGCGFGVPRYLRRLGISSFALENPEARLCCRLFSGDKKGRSHYVSGLFVFREVEQENFPLLFQYLSIGQRMETGKTNSRPTENRK